MKKKSIIILMIIISLFVMTGCKKEVKEEPANQKQKYTKEIKNVAEHVKYQLPEKEDNGVFTDLGKKCQVWHYISNTPDETFYPFDNMVETINHVTINGFDYETYKYIDKLGTYYVYRTKVNDDYHLFEYYIISNDYDDAQVEKFMNTVEYLYDTIEIQ